MNFLRLSDPLLSVLFEDEDILAIDKPYGFNAHTNDSKVEHSEFIQDGLIEIYEKQLGRRLHIIHRLDQTTTGVMIFGKSVESAKKYAEYFFNRQVKKTYFFVTKNKSTKKSFTIDQIIIHKGKEYDANTDFKWIKKSENFELWQACPHTGRNHQIRIHAEAAGIAILGDETYNGHRYPFLCLHNHRIEFPNGIVIHSQLPMCFEHLSLLDDSALARAYFEADRRQRFFSKADPNQSYRLSHKDSDYTIDQFGEFIVLTWLKEHWTDLELKKFNRFAQDLKKKLVVQKVATEVKTLNWVAGEGEAKYEIHCDKGQVTGLVLNQRLQRNWILENSKSKSVLSLFSQMGTSSLVAALGNAAQVTTVETSKKLLEQAKKNFELNQVPIEAHKFLCRDSLTFLDQCQAKNIKYDLIVCEVPAFFRREKGFFKIEKDLGVLIKNCLQCLSDEGDFLLATNFEGLYIDDIRQLIVKEQKNIEINCILPSLDFELPNERILLKSFLIRRRI